MSMRLVVPMPEEDGTPGVVEVFITADGCVRFEDPDDLNDDGEQLYIEFGPDEWDKICAFVKTQRDYQ